MMLRARGLSGLIWVFTRAQTTKWGVDRHNIVLSGHQSSQLPPDKLRGLFVPSSSSDRVKFNHRKISCEKICLMIETLNWCKRWVVESGVRWSVFGIENKKWSLVRWLMPAAWHQFLLSASSVGGSWHFTTTFPHFWTRAGKMCLKIIDFLEF